VKRVGIEHKGDLNKNLLFLQSNYIFLSLETFAINQTKSKAEMMVRKDSNRNKISKINIE